MALSPEAIVVGSTDRVTLGVGGVNELPDEVPPEPIPDAPP